MQRPLYCHPLVTSLAGALAVALGARFSVPMDPVPVSLQTLCVVLVGAWLGPVWGAASCGLYLAAAVLGLPVLADGAAAPGRELFELKTLGYLAGFPVCAFVVGGAARVRAPSRLTAFVLLLVAMLAGHALVLALGGAWLLRFLEPVDVWSKGIEPFLLGALLKSAVGALVALLLPARGPAASA